MFTMTAVQPAINSRVKNAYLNVLVKALFRYFDSVYRCRACRGNARVIKNTRFLEQNRFICLTVVNVHKSTIAHCLESK